MEATPAVKGMLSDGTPIVEMIARRQVEQEIEARERTDAGVRLAMPQFAERVGIGPMEVLPIDDAPVTVVPEYDDAVIGQVAAKASEWREELAHRLHHLDKHAPLKVHLEALRSVAQLDELLDTVADHFREQS